MASEYVCQTCDGTYYHTDAVYLNVDTPVCFCSLKCEDKFREYGREPYMYKAVGEGDRFFSKDTPLTSFG
jgi:hypothetical protein